MRVVVRVLKLRRGATSAGGVVVAGKCGAVQTSGQVLCLAWREGVAAVWVGACGGCFAWEARCARWRRRECAARSDVCAGACLSVAQNGRREACSRCECEWEFPSVGAAGACGVVESDGPGGCAGDVVPS